jgi:dolichol-phosphate mannosyltransferase
VRAVAVIPTYNERENLPLLVKKIREHAPQLDLLVVDDNSPDGTGQLAEDLGRASNGRMAVLHRPRKEGLGRAYVAGFQHVLDRGYDTIVQMDADLSHDPGFLPAFLEKIRGADVVLGSRYLHGIAVVNWDFKRLLLSKAATAYVRLVTGMPFTDLTGGFKCWRREALEAIGLEKVFANGYLFQVETTYRAWRKGFRIVEVPIIFFERNLGRSKMDVAIIWEALWGVIRLRLRNRAGPKTLTEGYQERR